MGEAAPAAVNSMFGSFWGSSQPEPVKKVDEEKKIVLPA
jgi:peroxisome-assembly ATPase